MYLFAKKPSSPPQHIAPQHRPASAVRAPDAPMDQWVAAGAARTSSIQSSQHTPSVSTGPTPGRSLPPTPPPTGAATPMMGQHDHHKAPPYNLLARVWQLMGEQPNSAEQIPSID